MGSLLISGSFLGIHIKITESHNGSDWKDHNGSCGQTSLLKQCPDSSLIILTLYYYSSIMIPKNKPMTVDRIALCHGLYLELCRPQVLWTAVIADSLHSEERVCIVWSSFFLQVNKERDQSLCFFSVNIQVICSGAYLSGFIEANNPGRETIPTYGASLTQRRTYPIYGTYWRRKHDVDPASLLEMTVFETTWNKRARSEDALASGRV